MVMHRVGVKKRAGQNDVLAVTGHRLSFLSNNLHLSDANLALVEFIIALQNA